MKKAFTCIAALILVLSLCLTITACGDPSDAKDTLSAEDTFYKMAELEKNLDIKGASEYHLEANYSKTESKDEFVERVSKYYADNNVEELFKNSDIRISKQTELDEAQIKSFKSEWDHKYEMDDISEVIDIFYIVTYPSGQEVGSDCYAVKVDGKWYILAFMI